MDDTRKLGRSNSGTETVDKQQQEKIMTKNLIS